MENPLLNDPDVFPSPEVLAKTLGKSYTVFEELIGEITGDEVGLTVEWRFYNDGKAWLGKVCYKKKTIFWLSAWDGYFQTTFLFTEKTKPGVMELPIDETLKNEFAQNQPMGKLIALPVKVTKKKQIKDVLQLVRYKKESK
ncbi:MAG TPA: hypothetical protein DEB39_02290 [Planctomycetaceae bacterium]|nr:hypothetical protein [Planctomycetaceae bacterium]